jgi:hypothetical protein
MFTQSREPYAGGVPTKKITSLRRADSILLSDLLWKQHGCNKMTQIGNTAVNQLSPNIHVGKKRRSMSTLN